VVTPKLKEIVLALCTFNARREVPIFSKDELEEELENIDDYNELLHEIDRLLLQINICAPNNKDAIGDLFVHLHIQLSNYVWHVGQIHDAVKKVLLHNHEFDREAVRQAKKYIYNTLSITQTENMFITDRDTYLVQLAQNAIVVNDDYCGIKIIGFNLKEIRSIRLFKGLVIDSMYMHFSQNECILNCIENESIIWVNLETGEFKIIPMLPDVDFSPLYFWDNDTLLLTTHHDYVAYRVNVEQATMQLLEDAAVVTISEDFYAFLMHIRLIKPWFILSDRYMYIVFHADAKTIQIVDALRDTTQAISVDHLVDDEPYHDFVVRDSLVLCIAQGQIEIINMHTNRRGLLYPETGYEFLRARLAYINGHKLIALSSLIVDSSKDMVTIYDIQGVDQV
jgi:hypothetical protein